jgi:hypothetical protein
MRVVPIAILLVLLCAPAAGAAGWSAPKTFAGAEAPVPRAAIAPDGRSIVAWRRPDGKLTAALGDKHGRYDKPIALGRGVRDYAVAPGAVAYQTARGIRVAIRRGDDLADRQVASSTGSEINGVTIAADPQGGWVVAERQYPRQGSGKPYRVRALSLDARGRRVGDVQDLGLGEFGIDARPTSALAVLPDGRAVLTFQRDGEGFTTGPAAIAVRPHGGTFAVQGEVANVTNPRVTVAGDQAVVSATAGVSCGDAGCSGDPRAYSITGAPLAAPDLDHPTRSFGAWAVRKTLLFQRKDGPRPFSREAPVKAVTFEADGSLGRMQTLTRKPATEPIGLALAGGGTLAVWANRERLDAALARADGRFRGISAPSGPPPERSHYNSTNRDARAAGRFAIVTWSHGRTVRVSIRRF